MTHKEMSRKGGLAAARNMTRKQRVRRARLAVRARIAKQKKEGNA